MTKRSSDAPEAIQNKRQSFQSASRSCLAFSLTLMGAFTLSHVSRPDALMFATIFPIFFWLAVGLVASFGIRTNRTVRWSLIAIWLVLAFLLGDSPQNLIRQWIPPDFASASNPQASSSPAATLPVRIISLNCMYQSSAIIELASLNPDVILLQESVSEQALNQLIATHFKGFLPIWSRDTSILVRGAVQPFSIVPSLNQRYQFSAVTLANGARFNVVSVHLQPSPRQFDIWNLASWNLFADLRKVRRRQLNEIRDEVTENIAIDPTVIGGDFNAPAGDQIFETMRPRFRDSWAEAGRGWGKTSLNKYPVHRIDQVWITKEFDTVNVIAKKSKSSDHRMVICDLRLKL